MTFVLKEACFSERVLVSINNLYLLYIYLVLESFFLIFSFPLFIYREFISDVFSWFAIISLL